MKLFKKMHKNMVNIKKGIKLVIKNFNIISIKF